MTVTEGASVHDATAGSERRVRFRESIRAVANRSTSADLLRWVLVPASILLVAGFALMLLGWVGAARTARQIEQIPYLISGGLIGLGLVFVGSLLLASAFWVVLVRKLLEESGQPRTATTVDGSTPATHTAEPAMAAPRGRVASSVASP
jgi:hypothetical protein